MNVFITDAHFLMGHTHHTAGKPCQDYAFASASENDAYAIVSDGCSRGGLTDVGSRIIVLSSAKAIEGSSGLNDKFGPEQITLVRREAIKQASITLGLTQSDMLATCLYIYLNSEGGFIQIEGDGVVAFKYRNGNLKMIRFDWEDNTPFYPAYAENPQAFIYTHGNDLTVNRLSKQTWARKSTEAFEDLGNEDISLGSGIHGITIPIKQSELTELEFVAVFSDGVVQVDGYDWKDVVVELLAFKTSEGEFVKRRMNRMVQDSSKKGRGPLDDISSAVIKIKMKE